MLNVRELPKLLHLIGNRGRQNTTVMSDFRPELEVWLFHACAVKICNITLYLWAVLLKFLHLTANQGRGAR